MIREWMFLGLIAAMGQAVEVKTVVEGSGYFPVMIRLNSGELLAVLRGGGAHVDVHGRLDTVISTNNGKSWSAAATAVDGEFDDRNPALGQSKDGAVLLAFSIAKNYDETGRKFRGTRKDRVFDGVYVMRSANKGKTWSKPERSETIHSFYAGKGLVSPYGKIVQLMDGTLLMAVYFEFFDDRGFQSYVFRSSDNGKSWGEPSLMGAGYNETGIVVLPNGDVLAALRSGGDQHLSIARSSDGGRTWSAAAQVTSGLEHPGDLIVLKDKRVLLSYGERNAPRGVHALLSADNGKTWDKTKMITLVDSAPNVDCGYPSSVQLPDGGVATMYYQVNDPANTPGSAKAAVVFWDPPKP